MKKLINNIKDNKKYIMTIFIITFIWGFITHGYMFFNSNLTHDSYMEAIADQSVSNWKIALGRIFYMPCLYLTRGILTQPWLIGIISLTFIAIAAILILKMFKVKENNSWINILVPGILTTNITIIALCGSFIHDMDVDMFAMLMSVLSVYLWKNYKKGFLFGIIPLLISLGIYQSYISVTITLIILLSVLDLIKEKDYQTVIKNGLLSILMIGISCIIYLILLKLTPILFNVTLISNNYNSVNTFTNMSLIGIIKESILTYISTIKNILLPSTIYNKYIIILIHLILIASVGYEVIYKMIKNKLNIISKILIVILIGLLPLVMNICRVLTNGMSHTLMVFAFWLSYFFVLIILNDTKIKKLKYLNIFLILIILFGNIRLANTFYTTKEIATTQTENYLNRVAYSIESFENYIPGKTKVMFIGIPDMKLQLNDSSDSMRLLAGAANDFTLITSEAYRYKTYFKRTLHSNVNAIDTSKYADLDIEFINNMPVYPNEKSIQYLDDILIVKLGEFGS